MTNSEGDPRVLFLMNLVLSVTFATAVVWALSLVGIQEFGWRNVALFAGFLMVVTYVVVR